MNKFNTSIIISSTHLVCSGLLLGVILTSDKKEETISSGLELLKSVLPKNTFINKGPASGPDAVKIDDSLAEKTAIGECWQNLAYTIVYFSYSSANVDLVAR